jgi:hypothetical protein
MARTTLTALAADLGGTAVTWTAGTADGHEVSWVPNLELWFKNTNVAAKNVTIVSGLATAEGADFTAKAVSIPGSGDASGGIKLIGNIPSAPFRQSNGMVNIDFVATESEMGVMAVLTQRAP